MATRYRFPTQRLYRKLENMHHELRPALNPVTVDNDAAEHKWVLTPSNVMEYVKILQYHELNFCCEKVPLGLVPNSLLSVDRHRWNNIPRRTDDTSTSPAVLLKTLTSITHTGSNGLKDTG